MHWSCPYCDNEMTLTSAGVKFITHTCSRCGGQIVIEYNVRFHPPIGNPGVKGGIVDAVHNILTMDVEVTPCQD